MGCRTDTLPRSVELTFRSVLQQPRRLTVKCCERPNCFIPFVMIFDCPLVSSQNLPNQRIRNNRNVVLPQESACSPTLIAKRLGAPKFVTLLKGCHNLGYRLGGDCFPVDGLRLCKLLPTLHSDSTVSTC
jgi:hypothetical protein